MVVRPALKISVKIGDILSIGTIRRGLVVRTVEVTFPPVWRSPPTNCNPVIPAEILVFGGIVDCKVILTPTEFNFNLT